MTEATGTELAEAPGGTEHQNHQGSCFLGAPKLGRRVWLGFPALPAPLELSPASWSRVSVPVGGTGVPGEVELLLWEARLLGNYF